MTTPRLVLQSIHKTALVYSFVTEGDGFKSWAICTVNDATGELLITSDWGNWSHRWDARPSSLGAASLSEFIATRRDVDYLARKLQKEGRGGRRWSADATVAALRSIVCDRRLSSGRERLERRLDPADYDCGRIPNHLLDRYDPDGLPWHDSNRYRYLDKEKARRLWNEIEETADECNPSQDLFYDHVLNIDGFTDYVTSEPWEHGETEQTPEDKALRDIVLPALIEACRSAFTNGVSSDGQKLEGERSQVPGAAGDQEA